jgi:GDPmannose 4,6-dehydratase
VASASQRRALITGIAGQDGSYLAELLVGDGCEVWGVVRDAGSPLPNLAAVRDSVELIEADLLDEQALPRALAACDPGELYHLASPSFVPQAGELRDELERLNARDVGVLLEAARADHPDLRIVYAASSEIFGDATESPQSESTPLRPRNPYGAAKAAGHQLLGAQRERHGLHASSAILFNHESPRRPESFLSRKVTRGAAAIKLGLADELVLGDLDATRDWGHARDVVRALALMARASEPGDYVVATGASHSVSELVDVAFERAGVERAGRVRVDPALVRAPDPVPLVGDATRARERLGWAPEISFEELIGEMVESDVRALEHARA